MTAMAVMQCGEVVTLLVLMNAPYEQTFIQCTHPIQTLEQFHTTKVAIF